MQEEITVSPPTKKAREPVKEKKTQNTSQRFKPGPNGDSLDWFCLEMEKKIGVQ